MVSLITVSHRFIFYLMMMMMIIIMMMMAVIYYICFHFSLSVTADLPQFLAALGLCAPILFLIYLGYFFLSTDLVFYSLAKSLAVFISG